MSACWRCRKEQMPKEDAQRLGLCSLHLQERVRMLMGLKP